MKVFITGATGFVGNNIARKLLEQGYEVNALVRKTSNLLGLKDLPVNTFCGDLSDKESIVNAMKGCSACFHVAANYSFWDKDKSQFYKTNVEGTKNILQAAKDQGIEKIIYTSSESTIKIKHDKASGKDKKPDYSCLNDVSEVFGLYKKTKVLAEIEVQKSIDAGSPLVIVAPTTPIGGWDIKPTPTGKIVLDFMKGKMPAYVNIGLNIIDVEDVAQGHILAMERGIKGKKYILGNKNLTLKQIFEILSEITKLKAPNIQIPVWLAKGLGYVDEFFSLIMDKQPRIPVSALKSASKLRFFNCEHDKKELGFPQTPVEYAFEKAVKWFKDYGYDKN